MSLSDTDKNQWVIFAQLENICPGGRKGPGIACALESFCRSVFKVCSRSEQIEIRFHRR